MIISPFLLVFYADGLYGQTERKMLDLDVAHSKQAVLVLHQVDGVKIFNSASAEIGDVSDMADCTMKILQKPTDKYRIQVKLKYRITINQTYDKISGKISELFLDEFSM